MVESGDVDKKVGEKEYWMPVNEVDGCCEFSGPKGLCCAVCF